MSLLVFTAQARENTFTLCQALKLCKAILGRNKPQARLYKKTCNKIYKKWCDKYIYIYTLTCKYICKDIQTVWPTAMYIYIYVWVIKPCLVLVVYLSTISYSSSSFVPAAFLCLENPHVFCASTQAVEEHPMPSHNIVRSLLRFPFLHHGTVLPFFVNHHCELK